MSKKKIVIISSIAILILGGIVCLFIFTGKPLSVRKEFWDDSLTFYKEVDRRMMTKDVSNEDAFIQQQTIYRNKYEPSSANLSDKEREIYSCIIGMTSNVDQALIDKLSGVNSTDTTIKNYLENQQKFKDIYHLK